MVDKSTQGYGKKKSITLFQTLTKDSDSGYLAVLSDDSMDRDGEIVAPEALQKISEDQGTVQILLNHKNDVESLVGEWVNRRLEKIDGHTAYVAEPKFFLSNPKAQVIKGMLDDGAQVGISIGAMVKDSEVRKINGEEVFFYTELELLEASFVAIPSNRHGQAMAALAKSYVSSKREETQMDKTYTEKEFQAEVDAKDNFEKSLKEAVDKSAVLTKELEDAKAEVEGAEAKVEEAEAKVEEADKMLSEQTETLDKSLADNVEIKAELEKAKKVPVLKAHAEEEPVVEEESETAEKAFAEGKLPIMRSN